MAEGDHLNQKRRKLAETQRNIEEFLNNIYNRLDSLSRIYHGTLKENVAISDWGLFVKSCNSNDARYMLLSNMTEEDGQWCLKNLEKLYYSFENVKTLDENFRKSVSSKTFALYGGAETLLDRIKDEIPESNDIILKPYKFNCHREGCFFETHKDTYSDDSLVGTLILIPCSTFEGGDLSFPVQDRSLNLSHNAQSGYLQFVYFDIKYSHAVELVRSGFRFSLIFNAYSKSNQNIIDEEPAAIQIETDKMTSDVTIKSLARDIHEMFKNETNVLIYDVFDQRLASELRSLFTNSIVVFFGAENPKIVYDECESSDDSYKEGDEYESGDFEDYVCDANSYRVNHIIGKASKLVSEQLIKSAGGNSPCSYLCKVDYFSGILLNPSNPLQ